MKKLKAAEELLKQYKSITVEQLEVFWANLSIKLCRPTHGGEVMHPLTGFSSSVDCKICKSAGYLDNTLHIPNCLNCIYSYYPDENTPYADELFCTGSTYEAMEYAHTAQELYNAIQNRINFLQEAINNYKNSKGL